MESQLGSRDPTASARPATSRLPLWPPTMRKVFSVTVAALLLVIGACEARQLRLALVVDASGVHEPADGGDAPRAPCSNTLQNDRVSTEKT